MFTSTCANMNSFKTAACAADFSSCRQNSSAAIIITDTVISVSFSFALALISLINICGIIIIDKLGQFTGRFVF